MKATEQVKEQLRSYKEAKMEYETQLYRYIERKEKIYEPKTPSSGDGASGSPEKEHLSEALSELAELETEIKKLQEIKREKKVFVKGIIDSLSKANERAIFRLKYIDGKEWGEIAEAVYQKDDTAHVRKLHRIHGEAIKYLAERQKRSDLSKTE